MPIQRIKAMLPAWADPWFDLIVLGAQVVLIVLVALLVRRLLHRFVLRLADKYRLPLELAVGARRVGGFVIFASVVLLILDRFGVSGTVLWTAFTGFATVAAVAFFAAWSVLSNIFCSMLLFTTRPFRLQDHIELLEGGEKPGVGGEVMDINLIYTTLREPATEGEAPAVLRVPNSLFFQRMVRVRAVPHDSDLFSAD
ncbi:mechanosensitive ion channel domain-containing protein [Aquabacterium sp. A3]|uniref:mechanosensitive ion channel domain-containing protein n=1 Tax=Aquabacterium sp. A3 TaxID=3132829 RepID=UPI003119747B